MSANTRRRIEQRQKEKRERAQQNKEATARDAGGGGREEYSGDPQEGGEGVRKGGFFESWRKAPEEEG